jgi:hypothetical protein
LLVNKRVVVFLFFLVKEGENTVGRRISLGVLHLAVDAVGLAD